MKKTLLTGIAVLFLATGTAHARTLDIVKLDCGAPVTGTDKPGKPVGSITVDVENQVVGKYPVLSYTIHKGELATVVFGEQGQWYLLMGKNGTATLSDRIINGNIKYNAYDELSQGKNTWFAECKPR